MSDVKKWGHDELLRDLHDHLSKPERMLWMDTIMGPAGSVRPDIFSINKSFTKPRPISYEVKVSKADFRSDITSGKWQQYLEFSGGVMFCAPKGIINKSDLPNGCGLMTRFDKSWRTVKGPTLHPAEPDYYIMLKLLMTATDEYKLKRAEVHFSSYAVIQKHKKEWGEDVCKVLNDLRMAQGDLDSIHAKSRDKENRLIEERNKFEDKQKELASSRGLMFHDDWAIRNALRDLSSNVFEKNVNKELKRHMKSARDSLTKILDAEKNKAPE